MCHRNHIFFRRKAPTGYDEPQASYCKEQYFYVHSELYLNTIYVNWNQTVGLMAVSHSRLGWLWLSGKVVICKLEGCGDWISSCLHMPEYFWVNPKLCTVGQWCVGGFECVNKYRLYPPILVHECGCGLVKKTGNVRNFEWTERLKKLYISTSYHLLSHSFDL